MNITSNILFNYSDLYENLSNSINIYDKTNLNIEINKTKSITDKIKVSINNNISSYLEKSSNNLSLTSNLDNRISSISTEYNEDLNIYRNDEELNNGIELILHHLETELATFNNYKSSILSLFANYTIEDYFKEAYENNIMMVDFCIALLNELKTNAIELKDMIIAKELPSILLELTLDITNKYINFINNSYNFAISTSKVVEAINNNVNIYILSSLSIIHMLNTMIEYANIHLEEAWTIISHKIVLFASLSYSLNIIISSSAVLSENHTNNTEGKNTDVLIIGNNIKLYPNKSLIIGYENDYTRWLELINDISKKSVAYFFNSEYNSCISSFNCRAQKFKSSLSSSTSLKTSTSIDINLIDTSIKNYEDSMFDGVSLKLSHIYHRNNNYDANANSNNTIFEIVNRKNLTNPYFSIYSYNNNNIFNIGNGDFYDDNNKCISEDTVVHINENTSKHLLKLSNPSTNPVTISFVNNNINNWSLSITNKFNFIYNTKNIISINPNGVIINPSTPTENNDIASLYINNTINNSALTLNNNYETIRINRDMNKNNMNISYDSDGIVYSSKNQAPEDKFDFSKVSFEVNEKILLEDIKYTLSNVDVSFNNINVNNNFKVSINDNNYVYILPDIRFNDSNISYENNATKIEVVDIKLGETYLFTINYVIPKHIISSNFSSSLETYNETNCYIKTEINEVGGDSQKYATIELNYEIGVYNIINSIKFYKYGTFINETLDITIKDYNYTIVRPNNIVPKSIYNNHTNTISKTITNNIINIINKLNYLSIISEKVKFEKTYTEPEITRLYPVSIFDKDYNIEIEINVIDKYDVYFTDGNESTEIEYINVNAKLPTIKQKNIYNNYHNIYSYTDDYEIYFNTKKLLNIDNTGTLTTNGNIHTNNIYLKGDIYNSQGISLYDNILSLINNITNEANYELNSKNIILNPAIGLNDYYKGGVLINGTNINEKNNNLFQINNYLTNDNFITLNSCTEKSYIHFNNKIIGPTNIQINSIYRLGSENNIFGIWKYKTLSNYNENYYIDTTIQNNCDKVFDIVPINGTNTFNLNMNGNFNGTLITNSDIRLKTDIKRIENALDKIMTLQGITYTSVENKNKEQNRKTGLIAQEVNQVLPEATSINSDGFYTISYGNLAGLIIEAIKELKTEINELKLRIT